MNNPIALLLRPSHSWLLCLGMLLGVGVFACQALSAPEDTIYEECESDLISPVELLD